MAENKKQTERFSGDKTGLTENSRNADIRLVDTIARPTLFRRISFGIEYRRDQLFLGIQRLVHYELERGLAFNLIPVALGLGILLYFAAPAEPLAFPLLIISCLIGVLSMRTQGEGFFYRCLICFLLAIIGMLSAKWAIVQTAHPTINQQITGIVSGVIISVDENRRGAPRYVITPDHVEGLEQSTLPKYVRLSSAGKAIRYVPGERITGVARLQRVLGPVYPGGYDFSFFARFSGIGGSGFFMGSPRMAEHSATPMSLRNRIKIRINQLRLAIKTRIETALPGHTGKIATALVIGDKTGIPEEAQNALRATGLAHILAISGLHMALVALTTLWVLRLGLSLNSRLALHYPIKKIAATGAFMMATSYLMISGFGVATQRAWIMISVMLIAVLLDRRAITLRNVAISAILILLLDPTSMLAPGFQMSFAAVVGLVSAYEAINHKRRLRLAEKPYQQRGLMLSGLYAFGGFSSGLFITSLVAGLATSFIAAWHFHQVAPLGLLANLLAMPIVTLLVMPAVLFSIVLMPLGLDPLSLMLVSRGIEGILDIAFWVNDLLPVAITGLLGAKSFVLFLVGFGILSLIKSRIRFVGLFVLLLPFVLITEPKTPDILIAESGRSVVVKGGEGKLLNLLSKRDNFTTRIWAKAYANGRIAHADLAKETCNRDACIYRFENGLTFYLVYAPEHLQNACENADILAAPRLKWVNCRNVSPRIILKREDFESKGSHEIYFAKNAEYEDHQASEVLEASNNEAENKTNIIIKTAFEQPYRPWHRTPVTYQD